MKKLVIEATIEIVDRFPNIDTVAHIKYPNEGNKIQLINGLNRLEFNEALLHEIGHLFDWYLSEGDQSKIIEIRERNAETLQFINNSISIMKVFKFYSGDYYWAVSGETEEQAKEHLFESIHEMQINKVEEISESKWDAKTINVWEDNDHDNEPYQMSIRECLENTPTLIFTNDFD